MSDIHQNTIFIKNQFNFEITTNNKSMKVVEKNYYPYIFAVTLVNFDAVFTMS